MSANFGFDVSNVFGDGSFGSARKGRKSKKGKGKKVKDDFDCLNCDDQGFGGGLGIDTFSLAEPNIDSLGIGADFGDVIGSRAGLSNGKSGGFLDTIGSQQVRTPSVTGRGSIARGRGRKAGSRSKGRTPLQRSTGTRFGDVDTQFAGNVIGNIRGAKKRISAFRDGRKKSKTKSTRDPPQIPFNQPELTVRKERAIAVSNGEQLALPAPRRPDTIPRESGSSAIQRLREAEERRSAT